MARYVARVALLVTVTIPGSSGASRSINCDVLLHCKSLFLDNAIIQTDLYTVLQYTLKQF